MNKNALMFNLHVEDKSNMSFYSMLYFALETLEKVYDGTFDVFVPIHQLLFVSYLH